VHDLNFGAFRINSTNTMHMQMEDIQDFIDIQAPETFEIFQFAIIGR
jgi:aspartate/glutamate racemase